MKSGAGEVRSGPQILIYSQALVLFLFIAAYLFMFVRAFWGWADEGAILDGAQRVTAGQLPGRDFLEPMGPMAFYWLAAFFRVFGVSMWTARLLLLGTGIAFSVMAFRFARLIGAPAKTAAFCFAIMLVPFWPANTHHWDSTLFVLAAFGCLLGWQHSRGLLWLLPCGILNAAAAMSMQQKGVLAYAASLVCILLLQRTQRVRHVAILSAGFMSPLLALFVWYAAQGATGDLIYANVIWPATHYHGVNGVGYAWDLIRVALSPARVAASLPKALAYIALALAAIPIMVVSALPLVLATAALQAGRKSFDPQLLPFWICGFALWLSELQRPDVVHLIFGSPIWLILLLALLARMPAGNKTIRPFLACMCVLGAANLIQAARAKVPIETRRGTLYGFQKEEALRSLLSHTKPGEEAFVYPYFSLYYFWADISNPTRTSMFMYGQTSPNEYREAVRILESHRVRWVLWNRHETGDSLRYWFPRYRDPAASDLIVEPYLETHYHEIDTPGEYVLMERNH